MLKWLKVLIPGYIFQSIKSELKAANIHSRIFSNFTFVFSSMRLSIQLTLQHFITIHNASARISHHLIETIILEIYYIPNECILCNQSSLCVDEVEKCREREPLGEILTNNITQIILLMNQQCHLCLVSFS